MHEGGCLYGCVREAVTDQLQQFYFKLRISSTIVCAGFPAYCVDIIFIFI